jgi:hypothetical protein
VGKKSNNKYFKVAMAVCHGLLEMGVQDAAGDHIRYYFNCRKLCNNPEAGAPIRPAGRGIFYRHALPPAIGNPLGFH